MSKKKEERASRILDLLSRDGKIDVSILSEKLQVSQVTIRKDLDELEKNGLIQREHGFASLMSSDRIAGRLAYHYEEKQMIAKKAAELINDGDTLMIESGSCCALLARTLAETKKDLTVITNSAFIAGDISQSGTVQVILLGGIYQKDSQCLVGPMIRDMAGNYNVRYFFIGTDGWSERTGFTNKDAMRAQAVRDMAHSCEEIVILTESEKFDKAGIMPMNIKGQPKMVVTDEHIRDTVKQTLNSSGIQVI